MFVPVDDKMLFLHFRFPFCQAALTAGLAILFLGFTISARILIWREENVTYLVFNSPQISRSYKNETTAVAAVRFAVTDWGAETARSAQDSSDGNLSSSSNISG